MSRNSDWEVTPPSQTASGKWMVKDISKPLSKGSHFDTEDAARAYFDQVSPKTKNYVIFDDSLIKIMEKNGQKIR